ncbi:DNA phosphorothioation-associated putative methyltransferase [Microbacterium sp.]|uniref:DNA phosphorothioation-associated putative methyltransferase n=1 Tax=Microbacterium sp. TaxID=51671 RepID=UPI0028AA9DE0|nr:DNA phosphorothioation-associated putative methyltransferase [Microbacterium sp.]
MRIERSRTALARTALSRPVAGALADQLISGGSTVFDYGCGRGDDIARLRALGVDADGWDPAFRPNTERRPADVVNLGYVVNVIEDVAERRAAVLTAWGLATRLLIVSGRTFGEDRAPAGVSHGDGLLTGRRTFQKLYTHTELGEWVEQVTGERAYAAAPGVFYLFRNPDEAQAYVRSRVAIYRPRRQIDTQALYETHRDALEPLFAFMAVHARPPRTHELSDADKVKVADAVGSVARGIRIIRSATTASYWEEVARQRRNELLVMLALGRFRQEDLLRDTTTRTDARSLFPSADGARRDADRLLLACSDPALRQVNALASKVGRISPTSLYVHAAALAELPPVLRVFEGCARLLAGASVGVNIIRLSYVADEVEYRAYERFEETAHPPLSFSARVRIGKLDVRWTPPEEPGRRSVLHQKEQFVSIEHPRRELYAALSRAEHRAGLYDEPDRIRTEAGWREALSERGLVVAGHRLRRDVRPEG